MKHILVVDDNVANLKLAKSVIEQKYKVTILTSGIQMLRFLENNTPDLILLDIDMPQIDGFEMIDKLKASGFFDVAPIIFLTALTSPEIEVKALTLGVADFIIKPFVAQTMLQRIENHLKIKEYQRDLQELLGEKTKMVEDIQDAVSFSIAELIGCRDGYTGQHTKRTCYYVEVLGKKMLDEKIYEDEISAKFVRDMIRGASLHDVGKIGIHDSVLCKNGKFGDDEFLIMQKHSQLGGETFQLAIDHTGMESFLYVARDMAFFHHEKWDGTGYVKGLKGTDIPLCARVMAVADVYDALTSRRSYKEAFSHEKSVMIIAEGKGSHFDPVLVDVFMSCVNQFEKYLSNCRM